MNKDELIQIKMNLDEKDRKAEGQTDKKGEKPKCGMVYDKLLVLERNYDKKTQIHKAKKNTGTDKRK